MIRNRNNAYISVHGGIKCHEREREVGWRDEKKEPLGGGGGGVINHLRGDPGHTLLSDRKRIYIVKPRRDYFISFFSKSLVIHMYLVYFEVYITTAVA